MSNYIEYTNIRPTRYVPITSRYSSSTVVYYTENKILSFSTYKKTNVPVLLNTSFNGPKEPMVESPEDAIKTFLERNLDILVINNFIIRRSL
jgi:hypothetical protein